MDNHLGEKLRKATTYLEQHPAADAVYDDPVSAAQETIAATRRIRSLDTEEVLLKERLDQLISSRRQLAVTQPRFDQLPTDLVVNFAT